MRRIFQIQYQNTPNTPGFWPIKCRREDERKCKRSAFTNVFERLLSLPHSNDCLVEY